MRFFSDGTPAFPVPAAPPKAPNRDLKRFVAHINLGMVENGARGCFHGIKPVPFTPKSLENLPMNKDRQFKVFYFQPK